MFSETGSSGGAKVRRRAPPPPVAGSPIMFGAPDLREEYGVSLAVHALRRKEAEDANSRENIILRNMYICRWHTLPFLLQGGLVIAPRSLCHTLPRNKPMETVIPSEMPLSVIFNEIDDFPSLHACEFCWRTHVVEAALHSSRGLSCGTHDRYGISSPFLAFAHRCPSRRQLELAASCSIRLTLTRNHPTSLARDCGFLGDVFLTLDP